MKRLKRNNQRIVQIPSGDYYIEKRKGPAFVYIAKARGDTEGGQINMTQCLSVPKELVGKRFRLKVEVLE